MKRNAQRAMPVIDFSIVSAVVSEAQEIAQLSADLQQAVGIRRVSLSQAVNEKLDSLLAFFLRVFPDDPHPALVRDLFSQHHPLTDSGLIRVEPAGIPLVVIRELITCHNLLVDPTRLQHWRRFSIRYNEAVN